MNPLRVRKAVSAPSHQTFSRRDSSRSKAPNLIGPKRMRGFVAVLQRWHQRRQKQHGENGNGGIEGSHNPRRGHLWRGTCQDGFDTVMPRRAKRSVRTLPLEAALRTER